MVDKPNFTIPKKRDRFAESTTTTTGSSGGRASVRVIGGSDRTPGAGVQEITVYHFYRSGVPFWMPNCLNVKFPSDFCRVALIRATLGDAIRLTQDDTGEWIHDSSIVDAWTWTFYKSCGASGKRGSLVGDVFVEENGNAWRLEGTAVSFVGLHPDAVAHKGQ